MRGPVPDEMIDTAEEDWAVKCALKSGRVITIQDHRFAVTIAVISAVCVTTILLGIVVIGPIIT